MSDQPATPKETSNINASQVAEYLSQHPEFLGLILRLSLS